MKIDELHGVVRGVLLEAMGGPPNYERVLRKFVDLKSTDPRSYREISNDLWNLAEGNPDVEEIRLQSYPGWTPEDFRQLLSVLEPE